MTLPRYPVVLGTQRTTVSLDTILSDLLAVKLGQELTTERLIPLAGTGYNSPWPDTGQPVVTGPGHPGAGG